jgi:hypothetical protein
MSQTLVVVPCGKAKIWDKTSDAGPTPARDTYTGAPFKVNREYAERFGDEWVILSAKYGFLKPTDLVDGPYNVTFKEASTHPIAIDALRRQIRERRLDKFDEVIVLGGKDYRLVLQAAFATGPSHLRFPFAGQKLGEALGAVKRAVAAGRPY